MASMRSISRLINPKHRLRHAAARKGFNLIESAIVLGVVGMVIGGVWVAASTVSEAQKNSHMLKTVLAITANAQNLIPANMITASYIAIDMIKTGIVPKDSLGSCTQLMGGWGQTGVCNDYNGSYGLSLQPPNPVFNTPDGGIMVTVTALPQQACIYLTTRITAMATNGRADLLNVGNVGGVNQTSSFPISAASPICAAASNNVYFIYRTTHMN